jgi:hypothetical protein
MTTSSRTIRIAAVAIATLLAASACGGGSESSTTTIADTTIPAEQRQPVGVVAEQVALDQHLGDVLGERLFEPRGLQQALRPGDQRVGRMTHRQRARARIGGAGHRQ